MIIYDILFILQFQVSTTLMDLVAVFALLVFMLGCLRCFMQDTCDPAWTRLRLRWAESYTESLL